MSPAWWLTKDGDVSCYEFWNEQHYSASKNRNRRVRQFVGPGQSIVLRTLRVDALFVWRNFIDDCVFWHTIYQRWYEQDGVNCAIFRNVGPIVSSELVRQADAIADLCWPGERHYTYVDPTKVRSSNPGFCFLMAGWRKCGVTKRGLLILERPQTQEQNDAEHKSDE
jgi:hypothetical protein